MLGLAGLSMFASAAGATLVPKKQYGIEYGAEVYQTRCTLCHGNYGLGEGPLAISLKQYPNTNLTMNRHGKDRNSIRRVVIYGASETDMNRYMPPWGDELSYRAIESVSDFIAMFYQDQGRAIALLKEARKTAPVMPKKTLGMAVFLSRCVMCHGRSGEGNGRLASRMSPKPANLVMSRLNSEQLETIISRGGKAVGRSYQMPPWGEELSPNEIKSVVMFLKTIR